MKKEVISERQGIILIILFIIGSTFLVGSGGAAKQDAWIAIIISIAWATIVLLMYSRILSLYPGKDLFDILQIVMGKFIGTLFSIPMIWFAFHLGALVMRNLSEFTSTMVFPDTPVIIPMTFFTILLIWGIKSGLEVIGRWSEFFIWVVIIIFIFMTTLPITLMDLNRLKPILASGFTPVLKGAFSTFSFPLGEIVIFTMVFSNIAKAKSYTKTFMLGLFIGGFLILTANLRNILVLGSYMISRSYFPSTTTISLIHVGQLLQRLEIGVLIIFLICTFIKIIMCLMAVCKGISKIFGVKEYSSIATPTAILMLCLSLFIYRNTMEMVNWAFEVYPYYSFAFEVIIPLIVFIVAELKHRLIFKGMHNHSS